MGLVLYIRDAALADQAVNVLQARTFHFRHAQPLLKPARSIFIAMAITSGEQARGGRGVVA
jgi:hypothetical protein